VLCRILAISGLGQRIEVAALGSVVLFVGVYVDSTTETGYKYGRVSGYTYLLH
jgi:hypothetical protein